MQLSIVHMEIIFGKIVFGDIWPAVGLRDLGQAHSNSELQVV